MVDPLESKNSVSDFHIGDLYIYGPICTILPFTGKFHLAGRERIKNKISEDPVVLDKYINTRTEILTPKI